MQKRLLDGGPRALAWLDRHQVGCTLVERDRALVADLRRSSWHVRSDDRDWILLTRPNPVAKRSSSTTVRARAGAPGMPPTSRVSHASHQ